MRIDIVDLYKSFGDTLVLDRIGLEIREREFLGLLGPSGSGKTTLLRILAGLEFPDSGKVLIDERDLLAMSAQQRRIGFVFQNYALFAHMSVFENIAFGLKVRSRSARPPRREIAQRVRELLTLVRLDGMEGRYPAQLSGGQRQRVALARALAIEPKVLLLDEPFGALDAKVRIELRRWLRELHDTTGVSTVFVTHDQEEALDLADRIAIMNRGRLEQVGTPEQIYDNPQTLFVYDFLGRTNVFECTIAGGSARIGTTVIDAAVPLPDGAAVAFVRPHDVVLAPAAAPAAEAAGDIALPGVATVRFVSRLGPRASVELLSGTHLIEAETTRDTVLELGLQVGSACTVRLRNARIFPHAAAGDMHARSNSARTERLRLLRRRTQSGPPAKAGGPHKDDS